MIRFGLCCIFRDEPIRFRTTTAKNLLSMPREQALEKLSILIQANIRALHKAIDYCLHHRIGAFRINSGILPVKTHSDAGYDIADLPGGQTLVDGFRQCGITAETHGIRLLFHPDQFIILNSPNPEVVARSIEDLRYHSEVAEWVGADVINIHGGGVYGNKGEALDRLIKTINRLPDSIKARLTLENDDRCYTPLDLLPVCRETGIPLIYDVHHHRCLSDGIDEEEATQKAMKTWNREPVFHLSSPRDGWISQNPRSHSDYIELGDFPVSWLSLDATVEIEAKAKELAVQRLLKDIETGK